MSAAEDDAFRAALDRLIAANERYVAERTDAAYAELVQALADIRAQHMPVSERAERRRGK